MYSATNPSHHCVTIGLVCLLSLLSWAGADESAEDKLAAVDFGLEIDGSLSGHFISAEGLGSKSSVKEKKIFDPESKEADAVKVPGTLVWTPVVLTRNITADMAIWSWRQKVVDGLVDDVREDVSIVAFDRAGQEIARWRLSDAWPSQITVSMVTTGETVQMVERLTIVHEGCKRVK